MRFFFLIFAFSLSLLSLSCKGGEGDACKDASNCGGGRLCCKPSLLASRGRCQLVCSMEDAGGGTDSGPVDSGTDTGLADASDDDAAIDAGDQDAGEEDAGAEDAGFDAGSMDAGEDAGADAGDAGDAGE